MKNIFKMNKFNSKYLSTLPAFKNEKNKQYLAIVLTLSASIFFALFAINPTLSTISKLKKEIEDKRVVEQKLTTKINNLSTLSQEYVSIKDDISYITDAIPEKPEVTKLTAQIQSVAKTSDVSINDLKVEPFTLTNVASSEGVIIFSLSASGLFDSVKLFISNLTNMERVISIDTLSLSQGAESSTITITGSAYYKK